MIVYTMVGTADLDRSVAFYDPILTRLRMRVCWRDAASCSWGDPDDPMVPRFFTGYPFDGRAAGVGNGAMTAFFVPDVDMIDAIHGLALRRGGACDGPPGPRPAYGERFYGAYVRDPDGNKLAFVRF